MNEQVSHLSVEIFGDVALGADTGFAQFQVFAVRQDSTGKVKTPLSLAKAKVLVSSGIIRVDFAPQSSQLTSMELCSYELEMGRSGVKSPSIEECNAESTDSQHKCIYPTVVSCDLIDTAGTNGATSSDLKSPLRTVYSSSKIVNEDDHHEVGMSYEDIAP